MEDIISDALQEWRTNVRIEVVNMLTSYLHMKGITWEEADEYGKVVQFIREEKEEYYYKDELVLVVKWDVENKKAVIDSIFLKNKLEELK